MHNPFVMIQQFISDTYTITEKLFNNKVQEIYKLLEKDFGEVLEQYTKHLQFCKTNNVKCTIKLGNLSLKETIDKNSDLLKEFKKDNSEAGSDNVLSQLDMVNLMEKVADLQLIASVSGIIKGTIKKFQEEHKQKKEPKNNITPLKDSLTDKNKKEKKSGKQNDEKNITKITLNSKFPKI